jgi:copper oxidase (laccase) domain-containing protein
MNVCQPTDEKRLHLDLKEINRRQLLSLGVSAENIEVSLIDTYTDERFFSARREQKGDVKCGRILSGFIIL